MDEDGGLNPPAPKGVESSILSASATRMYPRPEVQKEIIKQLAKAYGVKVSYRRMTKASGYFNAPNRITIDCSPSNQDQLLETFFHELGHYYCYHNRKFSIYHRTLTKKLHRRRLHALFRTAGRAELYVDKWAERECKKYFPEIEWKGSYRSYSDRAWLVEELKRECRCLRSFHYKSNSKKLRRTTKKPSKALRR